MMGVVVSAAARDGGGLELLPTASLLRVDAGRAQVAGRPPEAGKKL